MNFNYNFDTKEEKDDFLKTRIEFVDFTNKIKISFLKNKILTIRGLINKEEKELKATFNLSEADLNLMFEKLDILVLEIKIKFKKRNTNIEAERSSNPDQFTKEDISHEFNNIGSDGEYIISTFAEHFGIQKDFLIGSSRKEDVVRIRGIIIYILRKYGELSFPVIARLLGNRDHTTIIHSFKKKSAEMTSSNGFDIDFKKLIATARDLKENREQMKKLLVSGILLFNEKRNLHLKIPKPIEIPDRNMKALELYREGLTLEKVGNIIKVTRERVRQIIRNTIKQIAINESISKGVEFNYEIALAEEKNRRKTITKKDKPIKVRKEKTWSRHYLACESCGTIAIPHFRNGLCENCGGRSISGEVRENMILGHENKCDHCGISRDEARINYGRDFYLSRQEKSVLCIKCHQTTTGKRLGDFKKNKWRMFYK